MNIKELRELVTKNPHAYRRILKAHRVDVFSYVDTFYVGKNFGEKIYKHINGMVDSDAMCSCGKTRTFRNVSEGYNTHCKTCYYKNRKINSSTEISLRYQSSIAPICANPECEKPCSTKKDGTWSIYCSYACRGRTNSILSREKTRIGYLEKYGTIHHRTKYADLLRNKIVEPLFEEHEYEGVMGQYYWLCNDCCLVFKNEKNKGFIGTPECPSCYRISRKYKQSSGEKEVYNFIKSLGVTNIERGRVGLIGDTKQEIDIYLPDKNIAIEYNGVYWHHEGVNSRIDMNYHHNKFMMCKNKGIQLISIFSDTWETRKTQVKKLLESKIRNDIQSVYARKCKIKEVTYRCSADFYHKYHIQSSVTAMCHVALYHDEEMVACMSFCKCRAGIGKNRGKGAYELSRYATSCRVIGGASKLLSYFEKTYSPREVFSFSDNTVSDGKLYVAIGFQVENEIGPRYSYLPPSGTERIHRFNFSKSSLVKQGFDPAKTEKEIMEERGYKRVWDCGKITWIKKYK